MIIPDESTIITVLVIILAVAAAIMIPSLIIAWRRDGEEDAAWEDSRRAYFGTCAVCGRSQVNHDRKKHADIGIPIPEDIP